MIFISLDIAKYAISCEYGDMLQGIGKRSRERLLTLINSTHGAAVTARDVSESLTVDPAQAIGLLHRWNRGGWIVRLRRGLYAPVLSGVRPAEIAAADPWVIAARAFAPCYIGGWSAVEHWGLTDQIFETVVVVTAKRCNSRHQTIGHTNYLLKQIDPERLFGTVSVEREGAIMMVSDPSRTLLDLFNDLNVAGGMQSAADIFREYLRSRYVDLPLLISYAERLGNGAVFKRLGFIAEQLCPEQAEFIQACAKRLSKGFAELDPAIPGSRFVTRWRLKVSTALLEAMQIHG